MSQTTSSSWRSWVWLLLAAGLGYALVRLAPWREPPASSPPEKNPPAAVGSASRSASSGPILQHRSRAAMGSSVDLTIVTSDKARAEKAFSRCFSEIDRLDRLLTTWREDSEVSRINQAAGKEPVPISDDTLAILQAAQRASEMTSGLFDVTVGAFSGLWKFDEDRDGSLPEEAAVRERLSLVGFRDLIVDPEKKTAFLARPGMRITLGGIGKGYAVDRCVAIFREEGFQNFLVQAGGDLYVGGKKGDAPWKIGIRDPRGPEDSFFASFAISDRAFSTSGDYERFVLRGDQRYHHILDPRTGFPAEASMSVTVSAKDATTAEGLSKALFILGPEEAKKKLEAGEFGEIGAVIVSRDGTIYLSPELRDGPFGRLIEMRAPTLGP